MSISSEVGKETKTDAAMPDKLEKKTEYCINDAVENVLNECVSDGSVLNESVSKEVTPHRSDSQFDWDMVSHELDSCRTYVEVVRVVRRYILPNIRLNRKYRQTVHDVICEIAMVFFPSDHPPNLVPNYTYGDGNCFFRAVSHALFGTQERHVEIRVRVVFEAVLNESLHLSADYLSLGMKHIAPARPNLRTPSTTIVTRYCLYSGDESIRGHRLNRMEIQHVYRQDVMRISKRNKYAGIWQFHQAAEVAKMPVATVYLEKGVNPNLRLDMNRIIRPRNPAFHNKIPIYIMWSPLSKTSKAHNVKHFVVLFEPLR